MGRQGLRGPPSLPCAVVFKEHGSGPSRAGPDLGSTIHWLWFGSFYISLGFSFLMGNVRVLRGPSPGGCRETAFQGSQALGEVLAHCRYLPTPAHMPTAWAPHRLGLPWGGKDPLWGDGPGFLCPSSPSRVGVPLGCPAQPPARSLATGRGLDAYQGSLNAYQVPFRGWRPSLTWAGPLASGFTVHPMEQVRFVQGLVVCGSCLGLHGGARNFGILEAASTLPPTWEGPALCSGE